MSNKVKIVYVDDEVNQHIALESLIPPEWELYCFDKPLEAVEAMLNINPCLVLSDQKMPGMPGFKFLEMAKKILPDSVRIITTGYNDENSIVESIRKAQIFDYIVKPWDVEKMLTSLERAIKYYETEVQRKYLALELERQNSELQRTCNKLEGLVSLHEKLQKEIKCWVHPFVMQAAEKNVIFPTKRDLAAIVIDIIDSGKIHGISIDGMPLRTKILQTAWEIILKHGGEVESQEGDKIYANFGLTKENKNHANAAFAAAREFRSSLYALNSHHGTSVECGIAAHVAPDCEVYLREAVLNTSVGIQVRKKFDTSSRDIDLAHRIESLTHFLPGGNIIVSQNLIDNLDPVPVSNEFVKLGSFLLKGQICPVELVLIKSNKVTNSDLNNFIENIMSKYSVTKKVA